jgi:ketol-acid reductoisomerase
LDCAAVASRARRRGATTCGSGDIGSGSAKRHRFSRIAGHKDAEDFSKQIAPYLRRGQTLLFAHGFTVVYRTVVPPRNVDVVMVAPKGLGQMVRREFKAGRGVPALLAVENDFSGQARAIAFAWAKAIGCARAGVIETTFREETETDLFRGAGGVVRRNNRAYSRRLRDFGRAGYAPELAYFECLHELKFIVDMIHEAGIAGMRDLISDTAKWGDLTVGPKIVDKHVRKKMAMALGQIRTGKFAREFIREMKTGEKRYRALLQEGRTSSRWKKTGRRLRALMDWRKK